MDVGVIAVVLLVHFIIPRCAFHLPHKVMPIQGTDTASQPVTDTSSSSYASQLIIQSSTCVVNSPDHLASLGCSTGDTLILKGPTISRESNISFVPHGSVEVAPTCSSLAWIPPQELHCTLKLSSVEHNPHYQQSVYAIQLTSRQRAYTTTTPLVSFGGIPLLKLRLIAGPQDTATVDLLTAVLTSLLLPNNRLVTVHTATINRNIVNEHIASTLLVYQDDRNEESLGITLAGIFVSTSDFFTEINNVCSSLAALYTRVHCSSILLAELRPNGTLIINPARNTDTSVAFIGSQLAATETLPRAPSSTPTTAEDDTVILGPSSTDRSYPVELIIVYVCTTVCFCLCCGMAIKAHVYRCCCTRRQSKHVLGRAMSKYLMGQFSAQQRRDNNNHNDTTCCGETEESSNSGHINTTARKLTHNNIPQLQAMMAATSSTSPSSTFPNTLRKYDSNANCTATLPNSRLDAKTATDLTSSGSTTTTSAGVRFAPLPDSVFDRTAGHQHQPTTPTDHTTGNEDTSNSGSSDEMKLTLSTSRCSNVDKRLGYDTIAAPTTEVTDASHRPLLLSSSGCNPSDPTTAVTPDTNISQNNARDETAGLRIIDDPFVGAGHNQPHQQQQDQYLYSHGVGKHHHHGNNNKKRQPALPHQETWRSQYCGTGSNRGCSGTGEYHLPVHGPPKAMGSPALPQQHIRLPPPPPKFHQCTDEEHHTNSYQHQVNNKRPEDDNCVITLFKSTTTPTPTINSNNSPSKCVEKQLNNSGLPAYFPHNPVSPKQNQKIYNKSPQSSPVGSRNGSPSKNRGLAPYQRVAPCTTRIHQAHTRPPMVALSSIVCPKFSRSCHGAPDIPQSPGSSLSPISVKFTDFPNHTPSNSAGPSPMTPVYTNDVATLSPPTRAAGLTEPRPTHIPIHTQP